MNEKRGVKMNWAARAVPGVIALALILAGIGVAVDSVAGVSGGRALAGERLAAVLGVPIGPRLGIVPKHEVGRGDVDAAGLPVAKTSPSSDADADAQAVATVEPTPEREPVKIAAAASSERPSGIDSLRDRFRAPTATPEAAADTPLEPELDDGIGAEPAAAPTVRRFGSRHGAKPAAARTRGPALFSLFGRKDRADESEPAQALEPAAPEALAMPVEAAPAPTPVAAPQAAPVSVPEVVPAPAPTPVQVVREPAPAPVAAAVPVRVVPAPKPASATVRIAMHETAASKPAAHERSSQPAQPSAPVKADAPVKLAQAAVHEQLPMPRSLSASHAPLEGITVHANPPSAKIAAGGNSRRSHPNIMRLLAGKSLLIDLKSDAKRVSVANPEVAEVLVVTPRQVMINGLAEGETSVIIWDRAGNYTMNSLVVGNTLQDQVMLEVTVAEINRTAMEQHGVDIRAFNSSWGGVSQFGNTASVGGQHPPGQGDPLFPISLDGGISWAVVNLKEDVAVLFKQLQDENLARVLAEPKLLARSGQEANFLSGGEIPIVITQNQDTTIEFKEFGTKVVFVPRVREDGMIDLEVASEVSEPDFAAGVELFGFNVPAFITRRVDTDVSLSDGESLIIAGLIKETKQEIESKMPFIGDIPFLGYFFRATQYKNEIKELVMVVRPRLVDPIEPNHRVSLPTDRGPLTRDEVKTQPTDAKVSRPRPW